MWGGEDELEGWFGPINSATANPGPRDFLRSVGNVVVVKAPPRQDKERPTQVDKADEQKGLAAAPHI